MTAMSFPDTAELTSAANPRVKAVRRSEIDGSAIEQA